MQPSLNISYIEKDCGEQITAAYGSYIIKSEYAL